MPVNFDYNRINLEQTAAETDEFTPERYRQFARWLPRACKDVLDIGCSTGRGGLELIKAHPHIRLHGFDCCEKRLAALPSVYMGRHQGSIHSMPFPDMRFDAIMMGEFIEHLYPHDVDSCLYEVQRILAVKGRLLLTTPNPLAWKKRWLRQTVYTTSHLTQHFPKVLQLRLQMAGFSRIRCLGSGKALRFVSERFPLINIFGSYLLVGDKF